MSEIHEYVNNRAMQIFTPFSIINGKGFYILSGKLIPEKKFKKLYPVKNILGRKENPDKTGLWMQ